MSWELWIQIQEGHNSHYDYLAELAVSSYNLNKKDRKEKQKDKVHYFVMWWLKNRNKFVRYQTKTEIGKLLGVTWCTIIHYESKRKKSFLFEENTKCIKDFLNS